jgi:hypothetical protein
MTDDQHLSTIDALDVANKRLQEIDIALGGSGEWSSERDCGAEALREALNIRYLSATLQSELDGLERDVIELIKARKTT